MVVCSGISGSGSQRSQDSANHLAKTFSFFGLNPWKNNEVSVVITIYAPVNLMAPCIMVFMRASPLQGVLGPGTRDICG